MANSLSTGDMGYGLQCHIHSITIIITIMTIIMTIMTIIVIIMTIIIITESNVYLLSS